MKIQIQGREKRRMGYAITFLMLLVVEVIIALYVHDAFIRPYIGDALVVVVLYAACRVLQPDGVVLLPFYIFMFAALVEGMQFFSLVQRLGVEDNAFLRILIGSVFDLKDIACYAVGCIILGVYEWKIKGRAIDNDQSES